jgi:hypothetical protein
MYPPLKMTISREHPLLIIMAHSVGTYDDTGVEMIRLWNELDDVIRPHVTVQIEGVRADGFKRDETLLRYAQDAGIPMTLQIHGDNGDRHDTMPFETVRDFVDRYPCIVGLQIVEASQRTFVNQPAGPEYSMGRNARYARDIIRLAAERGLFMSWQLMRENYAAIGCSIDNEALFETVAECSHCVIPMHEMNCEFAKIVDHTSAMGLWLSGATEHWGVEAQSWYWSDSGYNTPGVCYPSNLDMPGGLYATMFLTGASAGATAYSIEPPKDAWGGDDAWRYTEFMGPLFKRLILEKLIPSRDDVIEASPVAYRLPLCKSPLEFRAALRDLDFDHEEGRLARAAYAPFDRARDNEFIPNDPRYGWIPILPTRTPDGVLDRFARIIRPDEIESVDHARRILDEHFPPVDRGDAWSYRAGGLLSAANSHEHWPLPQSVKLTVPARPQNVRLANGILTWNAEPGDRNYSIWRLRDDGEEVIAHDITETQHTLDDIQPGDRFAVSTITTATETLEGTLHIHQFLAISMTESRRSAWVATDGTAIERHRIGEWIPEPDNALLADEARAQACSPVEDLASPIIADDDDNAAVRRDVMTAMIAWKHAIEAEDLDGLLSTYAPTYREPDGRTAESVEVAFRSILWKYLRDQWQSVAEEWGRIPAWGWPVVRLLIREWRVESPDRVAVDVEFEMWAGTGPELEPSDMFKHPMGRPNRMKMTWDRHDDAWLLAETDPAFLRVEDTVPYRLSYQGW